MSEVLQSDDPEPQPKADVVREKTMIDLCAAASQLLDSERAVGPVLERHISAATGEVLSRRISDGSWRFRLHGNNHDIAWDLGDSTFRKAKGRFGSCPADIIAELKIFTEDPAANKQPQKKRGLRLARLSLRNLMMRPSSS